jgi:hypothetical protein
LSFSIQHLGALDLLARDEAGVARIDDLHPAQHLTHDHLDVLVVDLHALQAIHVLHLVDDVARERLDALAGAGCRADRPGRRRSSRPC